MPASFPFRAAALVCLLTACASNYTAEYQARLLGDLPDRREVNFTDSVRFPGDVLCGRYTSLTGNGFTLVTRDYVVTPELVLARPSSTQKTVYCSGDPVSTLFELRGIGGENADWTTLAEIRDDMFAIDAAVLRYSNQRQMIPSELPALLDGDFGVDAQQLVDPWAQPYRYVPGLSGGTTPRYELSTLGADGREGGQGMDADIARDERFLLTHVLRVVNFGR